MGGGVLAVHIGQGDPAGVLGLGRADQAPHRRSGQVSEVVAGASGDRAAGQDQQMAALQPVLSQPVLQEAQGLPGDRPHPGRDVGVQDGQVAEGAGGDARILQHVGQGGLVVTEHRPDAGGRGCLGRR